MLLVSSSCAACESSGPFYRTLADHLHATRGPRLVILGYEPLDRLRAWVAQHRIGSDAVVRADNLGSQGFSDVPALLIVDRRGQVTDVLLRRLSADDEQRLWQRLDQPDLTAVLDNTITLPEMGEREWREARFVGGAVLLDVRERSAFAGHHRAGATNIPADELASRAWVELPKTGALVVDCGSRTIEACRAAGQRLRQMRFRDVRLLVPR